MTGTTAGKKTEISASEKDDKKFRQYIDKRGKDWLFLNADDLAPKEWEFYNRCRETIKNFEDIELQNLKNFLSSLKPDSETEKKIKNLIFLSIHNYRAKMSKVLIEVAFLERKMEKMMKKAILS
jgi:hypothetical protein